MNLYDKNGYVDIPKILKRGLPFNFCVGGRATGKTYTSLKHVYEAGIKFMYMRRLQSQADIINKPDFSPFKSINRDTNATIISVSVSKYNSAFYVGEENEDGKLVPTGAPIGYTCALSTVANLRGFDASDVDLLIYDEFIPEKHERPLKNEGSAFLNAYETLNRNRELNGQRPLQVLCLANANDLANPLFLELGLVTKADRMRREGQSVSIDERRGIGLFMLTNSPISDRKRDTALYRLTGDGAFSTMSLDNTFDGGDVGKIRQRRLAMYTPVVCVGEITVYRHKSEHLFYISTHYSGTPPTYGTGDTDRKRFARAFGFLWLENLGGYVEFESQLCEILFEKSLNNS